MTHVTFQLGRHPASPILAWGAIRFHDLRQTLLAKIQRILKGSQHQILGIEGQASCLRAGLSPYSQVLG